MACYSSPNTAYENARLVLEEMQVEATWDRVEALATRTCGKLLMEWERAGGTLQLGVRDERP